MRRIEDVAWTSWCLSSQRHTRQGLALWVFGVIVTPLDTDDSDLMSRKAAVLRGGRKELGPQKICVRPVARVSPAGLVPKLDGKRFDQWGQFEW